MKPTTLLTIILLTTLLSIGCIELQTLGQPCNETYECEINTYCINHTCQDQTAFDSQTTKHGAIIATSNKQTHPMNTLIQIDNMEYQVLKAEKFTALGIPAGVGGQTSDEYYKQTNGEYYKIYLQFTNRGKDSKYILIPTIKLITQDGTIYDSTSKALPYITDGMIPGTQLQPNLPQEGAIIFELPKIQEDLILEITSDEWLSANKIQLTILNKDIHDIGKDTTLQQEYQKAIQQAQQNPNNETPSQTITTVTKEITTCEPPLQCQTQCTQQQTNVGQLSCPAKQTCCIDNNLLT